MFEPGKYKLFPHGETSVTDRNAGIKTVIEPSAEGARACIAITRFRLAQPVILIITQLIVSLSLSKTF